MDGGQDEKANKIFTGKSWKREKHEEMSGKEVVKQRNDENSGISMKTYGKVTGK